LRKRKKQALEEECKQQILQENVATFAVKNIKQLTIKRKIDNG
jgi:hypothetical protein